MKEKANCYAAQSKKCALYFDIVNQLLVVEQCRQVQDPDIVYRIVPRHSEQFCITYPPILRMKLICCKYYRNYNSFVVIIILQ
jgi:hypothetical protein